GEAKAGAPYIDAAGDGRNALIIRGTGDQIKEIDLTLKAIGETGALAAGNMRIIPIDKVSATTLAEELKRLLQQMRQNPVRILTPGGAATPKSEEPKKPENKPDLEEEEVQNAAPDDDPPALGKSQLVDPQQQRAPGGEKPGSKQAPI